MISKRVQGFTESVIREMTRVNNQHDGINLAQGMPNFPPPKEILEAAHKAIDGDFHQYAITWGTPRLRQAIAAKYQKFYGMDIHPDRHVTVCCGSTETMLATLMAVLNPGDEVIIFEPFYENYGPGCIMSQAEPVYVPLEPPDFGFDPDRLRRAVSPRTRAIIFNSPNNPTGKIFSRAELQIIADLCIEHDLLAITDEIYEHILYDGAVHIPMATLPGMAERTVTIGSAGKSFSFTGWKVGWATGPAPLVAAVRTAKQFLTYVASGPFQYAAAVGLGLPDAYFAEVRSDLERKRDVLAAGLERAGLEVFRPEGTYFITADIRSIGEEDGLAFCRTLPERCGVVAVPNVVFYDDVEAGRSLVRFAFCKRMGVLEAAVDRLTGLRTERSSP